MHRRNLMAQFHEAIEAASENLRIINANFSDFVQANPHLAGNLATLRDSLQIFESRTQLGDIDDAIDRFEQFIAPLDTAASELEVIIHSLDPN